MLSPFWEMGLSPRGVGKALMTQAPGQAQSRPQGSLHKSPAHPSQGQGPEWDKPILAGRNHSRLTVPPPGKLASHFTFSSRRENFLFVKRKALQTARRPLDIKVFLQNSILMV